MYCAVKTSVATSVATTNNYPIIEPLQIFGLIWFLFWFDLEFGKYRPFRVPHATSCHWQAALASTSKGASQGPPRPAQPQGERARWQGETRPGIPQVPSSLLVRLHISLLLVYTLIRPCFRNQSLGQSLSSGSSTSTRALRFPYVKSSIPSRRPFTRLFHQRQHWDLPTWSHRSLWEAPSQGSSINASIEISLCEVVDPLKKLSLPRGSSAFIASIEDLHRRTCTLQAGA